MSAAAVRVLLENKDEDLNLRSRSDAQTVWTEPFADLCDLDVDSTLQEAWITGYRARWAGQRAAASVSTGDGGAWLQGDAARRVACDAMVVPVVTRW